MRWSEAGIGVVMWLALAGPAAAEEAADPSGAATPAAVSDVDTDWRDRLSPLKDNPAGSFYLKLRPRWEYADERGADPAHALTVRAAGGFGSRQWMGLSFLAEGEAILAADDDLYFDGVSSPNGRSLVLDPEDLDLNQLYVAYENPVGKLRLRAGRQRILLGDQRFVGNVGWRQNEQTFDAVLASTSLGLEDVELTYAYVLDVRRIFGDKGPRPRRDFESDSHLVNLSWRGLPGAELTLFAYLLDFRNGRAASSNTFGGRLIGGFSLAADWRLRYALSYALQTDAGENPADYTASYVWASLAAESARLGDLELGLEVLGSDERVASFATPLGTLHVFNGYADAFLDNGGPAGLRDLFLRLRPRLPARFRGELALHGFQADADGEVLGWEVDAVLARPLSAHVTLLAKVAYFDARQGLERPGVVRTWLQLTIDL